MKSLHISIADQSLRLLEDGHTLAAWAVSTALKGPGEQSGSEQTPRGAHIIRARIGAGAPAGAVFRGRRPTGETWSPALQAQFPDRDWILTRILWLSGTEPGRNRLGQCDSMRRYIYIHGTPDTEPMGEPRSHGCIRMRNADIIELFERVPAYAPVLIE
ncbi:MAG: L,D-transpeptidase [Moraxellaceae bacterium]|jgi:lipoprotein-anchoring transpeptidase ErfK/SrfK|nr:L,D-transpeptidase [Moraxellaceae bacterium]